MSNNKTSGENIFFKVIRIFLGLVFIFSSFVKGVDPLGTAYRVEDYLLVYNLGWLVSLKLPLAILLITAEFTLGFALIFKLRYKVTAWATLAIMIFFTLVTWFDARDNLVPDCGCFGDAVKLTNWQTFYKNIVLLAMALILLFQKKNKKPRLHPLLQNLIIILAAGGFVFFQVYNYKHLPLIDFREWKTGNDMKFRNLDKEKIYLTFKNKITGELKEYLSPNYPWQDSVWKAQWEFAGKRIDDSQVIKPHSVIIEDESGNDVTNELIGNPGYQLLIISYNLHEANGEGMIKASELVNRVKKDKVDAALITATSPDDLILLAPLYKIDYPVYFADETELKAMIRSNPGAMLLHNGIILAKWHYNDLPDEQELIKLIR